MNEALAALFIEMKGIYMQRYGILNSHIAKFLQILVIQIQFVFLIVVYPYLKVFKRLTLL